MRVSNGFFATLLCLTLLTPSFAALTSEDPAPDPDPVRIANVKREITEACAEAIAQLAKVPPTGDLKTQGTFINDVVVKAFAKMFPPSAPRPDPDPNPEFTVTRLQGFEPTVTAKITDSCAELAKALKPLVREDVTEPNYSLNTYADLLHVVEALTKLFRDIQQAVGSQP